MIVVHQEFATKIYEIFRTECDNSSKKCDNSSKFCLKNEI